MSIATSQVFKKVKTDNQIKVTGDLLLNLQRTLLEMLKDFAKICEENGFYYSLCGGSALGAVRHSGFIPWDDDIDVFMYRRDIQKFINVYKEQMKDQYDLHAMEITPELGIPMMRLHKKNTVYVVDDTLDCQERGVYIDICVLEDAPDNKLLRIIHGLGSLYYGLCVSCSRFYRKREIYRKQFESAENEVKKTIEKKIMIGRFLSWRSLSKWTTKYAKWNAKFRNDKSKDVVCPTGTKHYFGEIFPKDIYLSTKLMKFEDSQFQVISNYDWALSRLYGDYMKIPPEDKRETHFVIDIKL